MGWKSDIVFVHPLLRLISCLWQKVQRIFVLQKRSAERARQGSDQGGHERGSAQAGRHERQVGERADQEKKSVDGLTPSKMGT